MDHAFLWCATSVVAKLTLQDFYGNTATHSVSAVQTSIHENVYEYDIYLNNIYYKFKYSFDSNTFARGKLEISQNGESFRTLVIKRDLHGFKVYLSVSEYIEFYTFNHRQLLGIRIVNGRKTTIASINITTERKDETREDYSISITPAVPSQLDERDHHLHMIMFATNGVANKDFHHCYDVVSFGSKAVGLHIFSDVTGQVICTDTKLNKIQHEQIGEINVINSDFNQVYEYVFDTKKKIYFIEERVENRHKQTIVKDRFSYREHKGVAYVNEEKKYSITTQEDNDIVFERI